MVSLRTMSSDPGAVTIRAVGDLVGVDIGPRVTGRLEDPVFPRADNGQNILGRDVAALQAVGSIAAAGGDVVGYGFLAMVPHAVAKGLAPGVVLDRPCIKGNQPAAGGTGTCPERFWLDGAITIAVLLRGVAGDHQLGGR